MPYFLILQHNKYYVCKTQLQKFPFIAIIKKTIKTTDIYFSYKIAYKYFDKECFEKRFSLTLEYLNDIMCK